ncbi:DUF2147 domain-containing protein [Aestuariivirga litoralis]|uniref:DUF2147 domain-containing protein n=1 Tax=Aestuariivirga litoralis TaxID=2650924 RepID=UPI0018C6B7A1|nr:DUF2147 domain-containing protein [Aestuariivirga litoralis]MBG1231046.1 DUF2147 domain-containing protein [Aestuariivirga litoralis]
MKTAISVLTIAGALLFTGQAFADPIEGLWKRPNGILVKFSACGGGFCATAASGPNAGGSAGKLKATGSGKYSGSLTDLENKKTYSGSGSISGNTLRVSGCVLGFICKSENWSRQ